MIAEDGAQEQALAVEGRWRRALGGSEPCGTASFRSMDLSGMAAIDGETHGSSSIDMDTYVSIFELPSV
jgi:hypothetical protein